TNAIVEGRTARTAFFTTGGFPDILLLREGGKPEPFRQLPYPPPYVPRYLTFELRERIDSEGDVFVPLDEESVLDAIAEARRLGAEAVAVCLIWSIVNPAHELRVGELLEREWPGVPFTLSHRLNPIVREYRRASSSAIDASLKPLMQAYLRGLERDLREAGLRGHIFVTTSFGGAWRPEEVVERPIYAIGSGPSMAPVAATAYARAEAEELPDLIVCDTGGTTFDVGLVSGGQIEYSAESWLGGRRRGPPPPRRRGDRRCGSRTGLLRPRRPRADDHRRGGRPRLDRPRVLPRRPPAARRGGRLRGHRAGGRGTARARRPRGRVRGADDRVGEHRRRDPGAHDRAGNRPARGDDRRRRRRLRAERRPDRARARLPARPPSVDRECALLLRRPLRRRHQRVLAQPLRRDALARPRGRQRGARR